MAQLLGISTKHYWFSLIKMQLLMKYLFDSSLTGHLKFDLTIEEPMTHGSRVEHLILLKHSRPIRDKRLQLQEPLCMQNISYLWDTLDQLGIKDFNYKNPWV